MLCLDAQPMMCFLFWGSDVKSELFQVAAGRAFFLPVPTGVPASILLDQCSAMASVLLQNLQSQRHGVKESTEAMLLCCKHKLSPKLAENHGFRASCVYSVLSALRLKLAH